MNISITIKSNGKSYEGILLPRDYEITHKAWLEGVPAYAVIKTNTLFNLESLFRVFATKEEAENYCKGLNELNAKVSEKTDSLNYFDFYAVPILP